MYWTMDITLAVALLAVLAGPLAVLTHVGGVFHGKR